jgi:hypothetical protein
LSTGPKAENLYAGASIRVGQFDAEMIGQVEGMAWVDFDGDKKADFCRPVTTRQYVVCSLSDGKTLSATVTSEPMDLGYPDSRKWIDVDGDGRWDFCRSLGSSREFYECTLSNGRKGFGRTIRDVNRP